MGRYVQGQVCTSRQHGRIWRQVAHSLLVASSRRGRQRGTRSVELRAVRLARTVLHRGDHAGHRNIAQHEQRVAERRAEAAVGGLALLGSRAAPAFPQRARIRPPGGHEKWPAVGRRTSRVVDRSGRHRHACTVRGQGGRGAAACAAAKLALGNRAAGRELEASARVVLVHAPGDGPQGCCHRRPRHRCGEVTWWGSLYRHQCIARAHGRL
mmetsp:Transcript_139268/g.445193  ORF Transcript_139268/g.445193 Transcript_139268/m.445193 type:complete len:211 (-) Transcript_139268:1620-2252(-)